MKISFNNNIYFTSRNEEIRTADNIQRKTKNRFNFISSSRIDDFFEDGDNFEYKEKAEELSSKLRTVILASRAAAEQLNNANCGIGVLYADDLDLSEYTGLGNCMEYAKAAIAALCANGYYNNERMNLWYETGFRNIKTGEIEYINKCPLDHCFAVTDLNRRDKKDIVVDPWAGFADYTPEAKEKFKVLFNKRIKMAERANQKLFMIEKLENGEDLSIENYKTEGDFIFMPREIFTTNYEKEALGNYARTIYPELILKA